MGKPIRNQPGKKLAPVVDRNGVETSRWKNTGDGINNPTMAPDVPRLADPATTGAVTTLDEDTVARFKELMESRVTAEDKEAFETLVKLYAAGQQGTATAKLRGDALRYIITTKGSRHINDLIEKTKHVNPDVALMLEMLREEALRNAESEKAGRDAEVSSRFSMEIATSEVNPNIPLDRADLRDGTRLLNAKEFCGSSASGCVIDTQRRFLGCDMKNTVITDLDGTPPTAHDDGFLHSTMENVTLTGVQRMYESSAKNTSIETPSRIEKTTFENATVSGRNFTEFTDSIIIEGSTITGGGVYRGVSLADVVCSEPVHIRGTWTEHYSFYSTQHKGSIADVTLPGGFYLAPMIRSSKDVFGAKVDGKLLTKYRVLRYGRTRDGGVKQFVSWEYGVMWFDTSRGVWQGEAGNEKWFVAQGLGDPKEVFTEPTADSSGKKKRGLFKRMFS